eukprot:COSAG02_NODE_23026_length_732_cov_1.014218_1_plen_84_part_10
MFSATVVAYSAQGSHTSTIADECSSSQKAVGSPTVCHLPGTYTILHLRYCASTKIYFLRGTAPPDLIGDATPVHDERLTSILDH